MQTPEDIYTYMQLHATELGQRILSSYPALHGADEARSPLLSRMLRTPYPAQTMAIMGVSKRWQLARNANVVAECGSGKTLIALGSMLAHTAGTPFSGLVAGVLGFVANPQYLVQLSPEVSISDAKYSAERVRGSWL